MPGYFWCDSRHATRPELAPMISFPRVGRYTRSKPAEAYAEWFKA